MTLTSEQLDKIRNDFINDYVFNPVSGKIIKDVFGDNQPDEDARLEVTLLKEILKVRA